MIGFRKVFWHKTHWLIVDTTSGKRVVTRTNEKPGPDNYPCRYLGSPTGESVSVACTCAKGTTTKAYKVFACAIFGECLPGYKCTPEVLAEAMAPREVAHVCRGCEKFVADVTSPPEG